jgi:hypothetical protein
MDGLVMPIATTFLKPYSLTMKSFSEFDIPPIKKGFTGDKIKIDRLLNIPIEVREFKVADSNFKGKCLHLQIRKGEIDHVVFTGSMSLLEQIEKVPGDGFPFTATIVKKDERYIFT